jgi:hypothetical protein
VFTCLCQSNRFSSCTIYLVCWSIEFVNTDNRFCIFFECSPSTSSYFSDMLLYRHNKTRPRRTCRAESMFGCAPSGDCFCYTCIIGVQWHSAYQVKSCRGKLPIIFVFYTVITLGCTSVRFSYINICSAVNEAASIHDTHRGFSSGFPHSV